MARWRGFTWALALAASIGHTGGCAATVSRKSGEPLDAWILGGSQHDIVLEGPDDAVCHVPRSDVDTITHPGPARIFAGLVLGGYAAFNESQQGSVCHGDAHCDVTMIYLPATLALGLLVDGGLTYLRSVSAARRTSFVEAADGPVCPASFPPPKRTGVRSTSALPPKTPGAGARLP